MNAHVALPVSPSADGGYGLALCPRSLVDFITSCPNVNSIGKVVCYLYGLDIALDAEERAIAIRVRDDARKLPDFIPRRPTEDDVGRYLSEQNEVKTEDLDAITQYCMGWFEDSNWRNGKGDFITVMNFRTIVLRLIPAFNKMKRLLH